MNGDGTDTTATRQMARTPTINQLVDDININEIGRAHV